MSPGSSNPQSVPGSRLFPSETRIVPALLLLQLLVSPPKVLPATMDLLNVNVPSPPMPPKPMAVASLKAIVLLSTTVVLAALEEPPQLRSPRRCARCCR